jgi:chromosome segregation ATPase
MTDLKRTLFGYSSASVRSALTERDASLDHASKNASAAEQRAARLSSELSETQGRLAGLEEQLRAAQAQQERLAELEEQLRAAQAQQERLAELEELVEGYRELIETQSAAAALSAERSDAPEPPTGPSTGSELAAMIEVAEQAVVSMLESTRVRADEELRAVDGERERIRRDVETMTAWRDRAAPMIVSLQAAMHEIQSHVAEIGLRVNEALSPVSTAVTALGAQLGSLDDLARAPSEVPAEAAAPSKPDHVTRLPEEHPASRDSSGW